MKKLFVTDLDGTFLDPRAAVSEKSAKIINNFIKNGGHFTFATARTAVSASQIMKDVFVNVPCILMNGVSIYDLSEKRYIKNEYFSSKDSKKIAEIFSDCGVIPFMYKIENEKLDTYYYDFNCREMYDFFIMCKNDPNRSFYKCDSLIDAADNMTIYFSVQGSHDKLQKAADILAKTNICSFAFYRDVYNTEIWFLEVFSKNASKSNGINFIKDYGGFEHITCFGDNLNDLPMFEVCDKKIAVSNAKDEIKKAADEIIGSNTDDAVAVYIKKITERI